MTIRDPRSAERGWSLVELAIVLTLIAVAGAAALTTSPALDIWSLSRAARMTERQLSGARLLAVAERSRLHVRTQGRGVLETVHPGGRVVVRTELAAGSNRLVDSVVVRPAAIRFNPRGHGAAGSVFLYRNGRGVRVISNFVGRIRRYSFRF